jgi:5'-3' exonuclease
MLALCVQGVPCVQAVGEAEAMCAALNVCGWAHAVHTADVDALLFGALTVYRQMHLQVSQNACSDQQLHAPAAG